MLVHDFRDAPRLSSEEPRIEGFAFRGEANVEPPVADAPLAEHPKRMSSTASLRRSPSSGTTTGQRRTGSTTSVQPHVTSASDQPGFAAFLRHMKNAGGGGAGRSSANPANGPSVPTATTVVMSGVASPQRTLLYRLVGTTSTRASQAVIRHVTVAGEEVAARRFLQRDEASSRHAIALQLYQCAAFQHTMLALNPTRMPTTNVIDGVPLLASMYVPQGSSSEPKPTFGFLTRGQGKASTLSKDRSTVPPPSTTTTDGFVVVKAAAYAAVRDTTPHHVLSSHLGSSALHRDPTSPPSHTPLRYPYGNHRAAQPRDSAVSSAAGDANNSAPTISMTETFDAIRQFDKVVRLQQATARSTYSETSLSWLPHDDVGFLFKQWIEFYSKWARRAGATPSSLLASFLCTMLIDDDADEDRAEFLNRAVMEETLEIVCDADAVAVMASPRSFLATDTTSLAPAASAAASQDNAVTYNEFCYVLRNVSERVFPVRDPMAAIRLLTTSLLDRYHRVHY